MVYTGINNKGRSEMAKNLNKDGDSKKESFKITRNCYWCQEELADHEDYLCSEGNFYCPRCPEYLTVKTGVFKTMPFFGSVTKVRYRGIDYDSPEEIGGIGWKLAEW